MSALAGERRDSALLRGALFNALGLVAKISHPLLLVLITWWFGPAVVGAYLLATALAAVASTLTISGYVDATTLFASPQADTNDEPALERLHQVLANAFGVTLLATLALVALTLAFADGFVAALYPEHAELASALRLAAVSLVPAALAQVAIAATKARLHMEYDAAVMGFLKPLALLGFAFAAARSGTGVTGLMAAHLAAQGVALGAAFIAFARHFDVGRTLRALARPRLSPPMARFAVPQSLNLGVSQYLTRVDVLLLAALGRSAAEVALYATAALVTSHLRQIKLVFSGALAPIAARHFAAGDRAGLEARLARVARWTTTLVAPVVLALVALRNDVLGFVDPSYARDTGFVLFLLVPPFLSCAVGLAGNGLAFAGRSGVTLINSAVVGSLNTVLNLVLIPGFGLAGAAGATALSAGVLSVLQLVELSRLEGIRLRLRSIGEPLAALAMAMSLVLVVGDPVLLPRFEQRVACALALIGVFGLALGALRYEDLAGALRAWRSRPGRLRVLRRPLPPS